MEIPKVWSDHVKKFNEKHIVNVEPTQDMVAEMVRSATRLMAIKQNQWVLDQLSDEQIKNCIESFAAEASKRGIL